jgi:outer membrane biosynthesis protein TonB
MQQVSSALALGLALGLAAGCAGSGDLARQENILRQRQFELNKREAHLRAAEKKFKQCVVERYPGEETGLDAPQPGASGTTAASASASAGGGALTMEALEEIQRMERVGQPALIACYTAELERRGDKALKGKVVVRILVGVRGAADDVQIGESTLKAPKVHACLIKTIRQWELPKISAASWYSTTFEFSPAY